MCLMRLSAKKSKPKGVALFCICVIFWTQLAKARLLLNEGADTLDGSEESVTVKLSHAAYSRARRDANGGLPDLLTFDLYLDEHYTTLSLRHNHDIDVNRRVYVMESDEIVPLQVPSLQEIAFFQDLNSGTAVGVTCRRNTESQCDYQLEGILSKGGNSYLIFPRENDQDPTGNSVYSEFAHFIRKINESTLFSNDFIQKDGKWLPRKVQREKRDTTPTSYNVELLMVTDSSVYRFWYDKQSIGSDAEKKALTLDAIRQYYAFLINAVDMRYKSINETDFSINVLFSGLLIMENPSQSPWTDNFATSNPSNPNRPLVQVETALAVFTSWVQKRPDLPKSDHVMLFTAYDLMLRGETSNAGIAYIGQICTRTSTSISENYFDFKGVIVAAHELGHSLGAEHDGVKSSSTCSADDRFIMAAISGGASAENAQNPWHFSSCSIDAFRNQIKALDDADNNCLLDERSDLDPTQLAPLLQTQPGQFYSLDTQCTYALGQGSFVCRSFLNETSNSDLCTGMWCSLSTNTSQCQQIYPAAGSSCGDRKWCVNGACVADQNAPPKLESCLIGDQPGQIVGGLTCAELKSSRADLCYRDDIYSLCCASCNSIRIGIFDCAFGDRASNCESIPSAECYRELNGRLCCQTCNAYRANITDCEFGDKIRLCQRDYCSYTQAYRERCCGTCYVPPTTSTTTESTTSTQTPIAPTPLPTTSTSRLISSTISPSAIPLTIYPLPVTSTPPLTTSLQSATFYMPTSASSISAQSVTSTLSLEASSPPSVTVVTPTSASSISALRASSTLSLEASSPPLVTTSMHTSASSIPALPASSTLPLEASSPPPATTSMHSSASSIPALPVTSTPPLGAASSMPTSSSPLNAQPFTSTRAPATSTFQPVTSTTQPEITSPTTTAPSTTTESLQGATSGAAPQKSIWEEWKFVILGCSGGSVVLMLVLVVLCCGLRTQPPRDKPSNKDLVNSGYFENVSPVIPKKSHEALRWHPESQWLEQVNNGYLHDSNETINAEMEENRNLKSLPSTREITRYKSTYRNVGTGTARDSLHDGNLRGSPVSRVPNGNMHINGDRRDLRGSNGRESRQRGDQYRTYVYPGGSTYRNGGTGTGIDSLQERSFRVSIVSRVPNGNTDLNSDRRGFTGSNGRDRSYESRQRGIQYRTYVYPGGSQNRSHQHSWNDHVLY